MRRRLAFLALSSILSGCCRSTIRVPSAPPPRPTKPQVRILTWNIFMMPKWVHESPANDDRARAIALELANRDLDILVFEKAFDCDARDIIRAGIGSRYPYEFGPANSSGTPKLNSGVWVLSRIELGDYHEIEFKHARSVEIFSAKGAMLLSGEVAGHRFQLVGTHLQGTESGSADAYQRVRNLQLEQIAGELVKAHADPSVPIIFSGDFGTAHRDEADPTRDSSAYLGMLRMLGAENGPGDRITLVDDKRENDLAGDDTGRRAELDYILLRRNGHDVHGEWSRAIFRRPWDATKKRRDLSYRYAVTATITFGG